MRRAEGEIDSCCGRSEEVALCLIAAGSTQTLELFGAADALGHHVHVERVGEEHDGSDEAEVAMRARLKKMRMEATPS